MRTKLVALLFWLTLCVPVFGQQISVQQPILGTTGVSTSVVVPNGGRIFLGGVSSAQSGRTRYGFDQPGSSIGLS